MRTLSVLFSVLFLSGVSADQPKGDDPLALIRRAIEAHGGADKLDRLRLVREQTTGTLHLLKDRIPFTSETLQRLPGQFRHTLTSEVGGKKLNVVQIYDGKQGWLVEGGIPRAVDEKTAEGWKAMTHAAHVASLTPLLAADKGYKLTTLGECKVQDRPAFGVKVAREGQRDVSLFFDRATGLLVKRQSRPYAGGPESVQEEIYSEFKDVQGLKRPTRVVVYLNGVMHAEGTVRVTEFLDRIDDRQFGKP
jgi:hypothetical protein